MAVMLEAASSKTVLVDPATAVCCRYPTFWVVPIVIVPSYGISSVIAFRSVDFFFGARWKRKKQKKKIPIDCFSKT